MTIEALREKILPVIEQYPIKRILLFGSRASGLNRDDSDVDLIIEFTTDVTLLMLSCIQIELEEKLGLQVDVIHGPMRETDMIEVNEVIELYAA